MECELPASYTARAAKKALPERSVLTKDARLTLNSAASMFTLYLSSVAHDNSLAKKRQTIVLNDVLQALREIDFEHFIGPIEDCLREAKVAAALKKSRKDAEKVDEVVGEDGEFVGVVDDDEEMQSAEDLATEEEDPEEEEEADGTEVQPEDKAASEQGDAMESAIDADEANDDEDDNAATTES